MIKNKGAALLKAWREKRKLSQAQLATRLGVSQPSLSSWERGKYRPSILAAARITRVTRVPVSSWGET